MRRLTLFLCAVLSANSYGAEPLLPGFGDDPGVVMFKSADYAGAERYFATHLSGQNPLYELSLLHLAKLAVLRNQGEIAVDHIEKALAIAPNLTEETLLAGDAYCTKARQVSMFNALKLGKKCGAFYTDAANQNPTNIKALKTAILFHMEAPGIAGGSGEIAKEYLDQLAKISEEDARLLRVKLQEKDSGAKSALALAEQLSSLSYRDPRNLYDMAIFFRDKKHHDKALMLFNRVLTEYPESTASWHVTDALFQVGEIQLLAGDKMQDGVAYIEKYITLNNDIYDPHYFWSRLRLATGYKSLGNESKYEEMVALIKGKDYASRSEFKKEFESSLK